MGRLECARTSLLHSMCSSNMRLNAGVGMTLPRQSLNLTPTKDVGSRRESLEVLTLDVQIEVRRGSGTSWFVE